MRLALTSFVAVAVTATLASGQSVVNGSMTGPTGGALVPAPWFLWNKTPDTVDATGPFNNGPTDWNLSPDGGTFVRAGGDTGVNSEAFAQNLTGYTPGQTYSLDFFQTNLGHVHGTTGAWIGEDGFWELIIDGTVVGASPTLSKSALETDGNVWSAASMSFIAPAADFELALRVESALGAGLNAYLGIDGARTTLVPTSGSVAVVALGGVVMRRRR